MRPFALAIAVSTLAACSAARLTGPPPVVVPDKRGPTVVVVEPFFESADWKITYKTEYAMAYPSFGGGIPQEFSYERPIVDKPVYSRVPALVTEQQLVIREVQRLRPQWQVVSTAALQTLPGPVTVVRVIVGESEVLVSDRTLKTFGLGIWPVHETQRVNGELFRYETDAETLRPHLLRYATQPDFAVDTRGLKPVHQPFGLEVEFEEGVMGPELARDTALVKGFSAQLAAAIIALVEGVR